MIINKQKKYTFVIVKINNLNLNFMAVPKERVVIRLKAFAGRANLSNTRIDELSARLCSLPADDADDAAIDAVITSADAMFPFKDIAAQDDMIIGLKAKVEKKPEEKTKEQLDAEAKAKTDAEAIEAAKKADTPAWALALIEANKKLEDKLTVLETGKVIENKKSIASQAFEKSEVFKALKTPEDKEFWLNQINVDSEVTHDEQIKGLETRFTGMQQTFAESLGYSGPTPSNGLPIKPDEKLIDSVVDSL